MKKIAIFVEGHTELIFVREFLMRFYDYSSSVECRTLFSDWKMNSAQYDFPLPDSSHSYQIINVGNDEAVLSRILKREEYMWKQGFEFIIGLRDMYSKSYRKKVQNASINAEINQKFIEGTQNTILIKALKPERIKFCFSIMEVEAWILGMHGIFEKWNPKLTDAHLKKSLKIDLNEIDPEKEFFHPAKTLEMIFSLVGEKYDKRTGTSETLVSLIGKETYQMLLKNNKCASFNMFAAAIEINR